MINLEFYVNNQGSVPSIYMIIKNDNNVISDSEISLSDYVNEINQSVLDQYKISLNQCFQEKINIIVEKKLNIDIFNYYIQDMVLVSKRMTELNRLTGQDDGSPPKPPTLEQA